MDQKRTSGKKKKNRAGLLWVGLFVLLGLVQSVDTRGVERWFRRFRWELERNEVSLELLLPIITAAALFFAVFFAVRAVKKRQADSGTVKTRRDGRVSAAVQRRDPRAQSFTPPEPSCIVCDHTGEDHFLRDKQQRLSQLSEWLKNGLIDKNEYQVLKARYERDL